MLVDVGVEHGGKVSELGVLEVADDIDEDLEDEAGVAGGVAVLRGEHLEEGVEDVLQELDDLLPLDEHDPLEGLLDLTRVRLPVEQLHQIH